MATTSFDSSTTQTTAGSRRASRQIRHCSSSATLPQTEQNRTFSLTSTSALARRLTSASSADSRWKAMRCALFGPTPGNRPSSSIRDCTAPSYIAYPFIGPTRRGRSMFPLAAHVIRADDPSRTRRPSPPSRAWRSSHTGEPTGHTPGHSAETLGERAHLLLLHPLDLRLGVADRGEHEVGDGLCRLVAVGGVDRRGVDGDVLDLTAATQLDLAQAATGAAFDLRLVQGFLRLDELLLHLLGLLEQGLHVHSLRVHGRLPRWHPRCRMSLCRCSCERNR